MNFDFLKTPSTIAALLIVLLYFLPFTPYVKSVRDNGQDGDDKITTTTTITGLGMLTGSLSMKKEGKDVEQPKEETIKRAKEQCFGPKPDYAKENKDWTPMYGILDKLGILLVLGCGLMVFTAYQKSANQSPTVDEDKMGWIKIVVIGLGLMILSRYCFDNDMTTTSGGGIGAWISLLAVIFLALEDRIMKLMGK
jgi:hypothetical protein